MVSFFATLRGIPLIFKYLLTCIVGMTPIIEIRGAIPLGVAMGLDYWSAYICSFIGNIIPIFCLSERIFISFMFMPSIRISPFCIS